MKTITVGRLFNAITAQDDTLVTVPDEQGSYDIEYIEVRGLRARVAQSVGIKRNANVIIDTIQSVDMQVPDQTSRSAAACLWRIYRPRRRWRSTCYSEGVWAGI